MMVVAAIVLLAGGAALALSQQRHFRRVFGAAPIGERGLLCLRGGGFALLALAFALLAQSLGWVVAAVIFPGLCAPLFLSLALLLTYCLPAAR